MEELGQLSQIVAVSIDGVRLGVEITRDSLVILQRLSSIFWVTGRAARNKWTNRVRAGKTWTQKGLLKKDQNISFVKIHEDEYKKFQKLAKKHGILYTALPSYSTAENVEMRHIMYSAAVAPRMQSVLDIMNSQHIGDKQENEMETAEEYMKESGAVSLPDEQFDVEMKEMYPDQMQELETLKSKKNLIPEQKEEIEKAAARNKLKQRRQDKENYLSFSFNVGQVVKQNRDQILIHPDKTDGVYIWMNRDNILKENNQIYTAVIRKDCNVEILADIHNDRPSKVKAMWLEKQIDTQQIESITISKKNFVEETKEKVKTLIPRTKGNEFVWIDKQNLSEVHDGKSIRTFLDKTKQYEIYSRDGQWIRNATGEELWSRNYSHHDNMTRRNIRKIDVAKKGTAKTVPTITRK